ncbi:VOC family protein [Nocardioides jensenii]|uniref:VOC family protein n=1 Tax=Nocardioides jensenii TaxID=1843 RepID=UPI000835B8BB|nr:VOC family protein [Nocardioides jensenii]
MGSPFWISAFLDLPWSSYESGVMFWSEVTGYRVSAPRGARNEFATLVPATGDSHLRAQRLGDGAAGLHLDLHVSDARAAAGVAEALGATTVADHGYVVLRSPGGFVFCFVEHPCSGRAAPAVWPDGTASVVDQVCLDIPASAYDRECAFWEALTGWPLDPLPEDDEFTALERPGSIPLRLLLQRLGERSGEVRAHFDLASDDRAAEVRRHAGLGAQLLAEHPGWTVLRDPAGSSYCITDRSPAR